MSQLVTPVNFMKWIDENRDKLKPPVCNEVVWENTDYIAMVVGGPNSRKDYHYNETPEFFYQVEGDMVLKVIDDGEFRDVHIREGEIFTLPPKVPHSPQRFPNTVGLVIESKRPEGVMDALEWYCESCGHQLYREPFPLENIVTQMPVIFDRYYSDEKLRTCDNCGHEMQPPK
ncbi:MAG: 3-hydroxyanthranilate 3,4-dioxygenase [Saprospiraceae bacterium]|nr:3-hydroxyanthranilate 3,4-dioxygenase [Saprospiraceae bacterium]MCB9326692.1 3-hydroxyanthranilate 3,4-dioxygenase [Lewinellaceae bacterium]